MISSLSSAGVKNPYTNSFNEVKKTLTSEGKGVANISKQGDMSKIESLKESIENGEYKINIEALSKKIAEELL